MTCSAYIKENGMYGRCFNGFPQAPGCRSDNPNFRRPCLDEEWCGRRYEQWGGKPPNPLPAPPEKGEEK